MPQQQEYLTGGDVILKCISLAPASFNDLTNCFEVVPLTIESSTSTIDFPFNTLLRGFNFIFTPIKCSSALDLYYCQDNSYLLDVFLVKYFVL